MDEKLKYIFYDNTKQHKFETTMTTDWLLRVGNGHNLKGSSKYRIWGVNSMSDSNVKKFIANVQSGDRLWFVKTHSNGQLIAVATYRSHNKRELGPLLEISLSNQDLNWTNYGGSTWDTEIHYTDLYNLESCEMYSHIGGLATIRKYNEKCRVNLPVEYTSIVRYSQVSREL